MRTTFNSMCFTVKNQIRLQPKKLVSRRHNLCKTIVFEILHFYQKTLHEPHIKRQKRWREMFNFRKDICKKCFRVVNTRKPCQQRLWLRRHSVSVVLTYRTLFYFWKSRKTYDKRSKHCSWLRWNHVGQTCAEKVGDSWNPPPPKKKKSNYVSTFC